MMITKEHDTVGVRYKKRKWKTSHMAVSRSTRYYSKRQETKVAKAVNGRRTPNSGATPFVKGDIIADDWLIECKTKVKDSSSFTIKEDWLLKNEEEAFAMGKPNSALVFDFGPSANKRYYVISERLFQLLQQYMKEDK